VAGPLRFPYSRLVIALAVHGGAGAEGAEDREPRRAGVARAAEVGWAILAAGGSALDAVVEAVALLEDDPHFNAGYGSVLTEDGIVEMDASVMAGDGLRAGAVGAVQGVQNPVRLAHAVLREGREVFLVGEPAVVMARQHGVPTLPPDSLVTAEARRRWQARGTAPGETVGAVACDAGGHVAAATSTGGVARKRRGRIGDSAIIGAGTFADDRLGAGSATGPGEAIIRVTLVRHALELVGRGLDPAAAARLALGSLSERTGAAAGLLLIDPAGRLGVAHTSEAMAAAYRSARDHAIVVLS
jgi:L-asparaginase / beta-aspartyl-peptidase